MKKFTFTFLLLSLTILANAGTRMQVLKIDILPAQQHHVIHLGPQLKTLNNTVKLTKSNGLSPKKSPKQKKHKRERASNSNNDFMNGVGQFFGEILIIIVDQILVDIVVAALTGALG